MSDLNELDWSRNGIGVVQPQIATKGFTPRDMHMLQRAQKSGMADRDWRWTQFCTNDFSQYLAIWDKTSEREAPPPLSIVRFDKTGTYALLKAGKIIASGEALDVILPTLGIVDATVE
jgi:hypothetical protein